MSKKPNNLLYGVNDSPPPYVSVILGIQHMCILFVAMVFPVTIIHQFGDNISAGIAQSFVSLSMIAGGISTLIQAYKFGPVGSGYFCPSVSGPAYLSASQAAAAVGGLPLLFGMTLLSGVIESLFSRVMNKLRFLFPVEVTGLIVAMVGIVVLPLSVINFFGATKIHPRIEPGSFIVGLVSLSIMIGLNIWSKGKFKLFCTLIGMVAGYILAIFLGLISQLDYMKLASANFFHFPQLSHISWSFDFTLIIPFTVATICSSFKTIGDIVTCQKINDTEWKRPDLKNVSAGILADGLGGVIPGLIGGYGQSTSSANVGMSIATGSTARKIAIPLSIMFIALGFFPKFAEVFIIMPKPVMGAALIFSVSFMITTGFQMMMSRLLDARKIFVIGTSLIFGLSVDMVPGLYNEVHPWIKPVFSSTLSLTTIVAITLNVIFRIGISKKKSISINKADNIAEKIFSFMEEQGGLWGARKDVFTKGSEALTEICEALMLSKISKSPIDLTVHFDEFKVKIEIEYSGFDLELQKHKPTETEIIGEGGAMKLSGYLVNQYADKIKSETKGERKVIILMFEH